MSKRRKKEKNAARRIECGKRFVTDLELVALSGALNVSVEALLFPETNETEHT